MLRARARLATALRCPYCRDDLLGEVLVCRGCDTTFHRECVEEGLRACPTLGCGARLRRSILDQPPVVFDAPQPPAWFWPAATIGFLITGLLAIWTAEHRLPHLSGGYLAFRGLGWLYTVAGGAGIASWLHDLGVDLSLLVRVGSGVRLR